VKIATLQNLANNHFPTAEQGKTSASKIDFPGSFLILIVEASPLGSLKFSLKAGI